METLKEWITTEEEYNGKFYTFIKCPYCKSHKILVSAFIRKEINYCPHCGEKLKQIKLEWDDGIN